MAAPSCDDLQFQSPEPELPQTAPGIQSLHLETESPENIARQLFQRITGRPLVRRNELLLQLANLIREGKTIDAVRLMTKEPSFVTSTARQWASILISRDHSPDLPLTDSLATIMGAIRDDLDARSLLTGNYVYGSDPRLNLGRPSASSNTIYSRIEGMPRELANLLTFVTPQWDLATHKETAGILTTRGWAEIYYSAGTNRRAVLGALDVFLCVPNDRWKYPGLPTFRIRQDVSRKPAENAQVFQNECRSCHAPMDALAGAFAYADFVNTTFTFSSAVLPKFIQNTDTYPEGMVTHDDSWVNLFHSNQDALFGWRGEKRGHGIQAFGEMLASSQAFSACMVKRTMAQVCYQKRELADPVVQEFAQKFEASGYRLKELFSTVASDSRCLEAMED